MPLDMEKNKPDIKEELDEEMGEEMVEDPEGSYILEHQGTPLVDQISPGNQPNKTNTPETDKDALT